jgi:peptidoglycan hydrolase-like amidase
VQDVTLTFTGGTVTTTGDTLRTYLGLRSTWFTVAVAPMPARPRG